MVQFYMLRIFFSLYKPCMVTYYLYLVTQLDFCHEQILIETATHSLSAPDFHPPLGKNYDPPFDPLKMVIPFGWSQNRLKIFYVYKAKDLVLLLPYIHVIHVHDIIITV